jgi:predicted transcriptional regulator
MKFDRPQLKEHAALGKISKIQERESEALEMIKNGAGYCEIANRFGVSQPTVSAYFLRRGIHIGKKRPKKVDDLKVERFLAEGLTHSQIAVTLGVSQSAIERRVRARGFQSARTGPRSGQDHPDWIDGRRLDKHGYAAIYVPLHPYARNSGRVLEHRLVKEVEIGRYLLPDEVVHHRDDHPRHNWPDNLELFGCNADHLIHELENREKATPRGLIPGAYMSPEKIARCPSEHETLAQCSSEIRQRLAYHIEIHRPTTEHRSLARRELRLLGARLAPFQWPSTE